MAVSHGSIIVLILSIALTVDYARSQTYGEREREREGPGPATGTVGMGTTDMMMTTVGAGEIEPLEPGEGPTTTTKPTTKKPKKKPRRRPKTRKGRPKNLKPRPKGKRRQKAVKPAAKVTTPMPVTKAPTLAPTTRRPTPAPTAAPVPIVPAVQPVVQAVPVAAQPAQGVSGGGQYAASANGAGAAYAPPEVRVVPQVYQQPVPTTTPAPATKSPTQYLYEPHSCPKMDVATWENEVVIYDNKNCAIIVRMNPRLRRPTVTFQAPYW